MSFCKYKFIGSLLPGLEMLDSDDPLFPSRRRFELVPLESLQFYAYPSLGPKQHFFIPEEPRCLNCQKTSQTFLRCGICQISRFCSVDCQRQKWREHKPLCRKPNSFSHQALIIEIFSTFLPYSEWDWIFSLIKKHVFDLDIDPNNIYLTHSGAWKPNPKALINSSWLEPGTKWST